MATEQFHKLNNQKQEKILDAVLKEFAQHGYDSASTNRIVENANISKGILFKYFNKKEELFIFICEKKSIEKAAWMTGDYELPEDFFEILRAYTIREMRFFRKEPEFFMISQQLKFHPDHEVHKKAIEIMQSQSALIAEKLFSNLPSNRLKDGISMSEALTFTNWVLEGFNRTIDVDISSNLWEENVLKKVDRTFELIKYGVYKV